MGTFLDKRTIAGLTSQANITFPHGLGKNPDAVIVRFVASIATTSYVQIAKYIDASNVTLVNFGNVTCPAMEVCTLVFHGIMQ
jgi:hypothetical protein